jgi:hypothetical protein
MFALSRGGDCETIEQYVLHSLWNAGAKLRKRIGIDKEKEKKMKKKGKGQRVVGIKALGRHYQFFISL